MFCFTPNHRRWLLDVSYDTTLWNAIDGWASDGLGSILLCILSVQGMSDKYINHNLRIIVNIKKNEWNLIYFLILIQANHSYKNGGRRVAIIMTCYSLLVSVVYVINKNPIFHQV